MVYVSYLKMLAIMYHFLTDIYEFISFIKMPSQLFIHESLIICLKLILYAL